VFLINILFFVIISVHYILRRMPITKKSGSRHHVKGKRTRSKRSHKRRSRVHKKKRSTRHKRRRRTRSMRGRRGRRGAMHGGSTSALVPSPWIPSDMTNIYRTATGGMIDAGNAMSGLEPNPSPLPYKDQLVGDGNMVGEILRMA